MLTRRTIILAVACAAIAAPATADDASALAFVTGIYKQYGRHDTNAHPLDTDSGIRRYFEPSLAAAIIKDRADAAKRGEEGNLDFDPFIYGNDDWDMSDLDIDVYKRQRRPNERAGCRDDRCRRSRPCRRANRRACGSPR